jgi:hypothetical protein
MKNREDILFIVGMPRSGTKLLRDLLNEHSEISIPYVESQIFPDLVERFGTESLSDIDLLDLHEIVSGGIFAYNLRKDYGKSYDRAVIEELMEEKTIAGYIRALLHFYGPKDGQGLLLGDKTPSYLGKIESLHRAFPKLKLIHIVRDPRDRALSAQKIWGTPLLDSAEKWRYFNTQATKQIEDIGDSVLEIRYEDLLTDPETTLKDICSFLDISFENNMLHLGISTEKYGDARDRKKIDPSNLEKYRKRLSKKQWKRIEEICLPEMEKKGYSIEQATTYKPLSPLEKKYLWAVGGSRMLYFHIKDKGLFRGTWYFLKGRQTKKWKNK